MSLTAQLNVTPDGFCNHADVVIDDQFNAFAVQCLEEADRLLLGRKTFDLFAGHWPRAAKDASLPEGEQRLARAIDDIEKLVISRSLSESDWKPTSILSDFDEPAARSLSRSGRTIVLGSPSIISQLAAWGALDRLMLSVHPVMGQQGARLFDELVPKTLVFEREFPTGSSVRTYVFAAAPEH